jgi:hypothetical protein
MKAPLFAIALTAFSIFPLAYASSDEGCTVGQNPDWTDTAGIHFKVYDGAGEYLGYVTELDEVQGQWTIWVEAEGESNAQFDGKEEAVATLCSTASEK